MDYHVQYETSIPVCHNDEVVPIWSDEIVDLAESLRALLH